MKTTVIETTWLPGSTTGWGNGYVVIPEGHKLHGEHYDKIDVDVHGGLTYSDELTEDRRNKMFPDIEDEHIGGWVVGFDCAHFGDDLETCPKSFVEQETENLKTQLESL